MAHILFPLRALKINERGDLPEMNAIKQFLFVTVMIIGFSLTVSAQKDDGKKDPPPKEKPPVIVVKPKDPPPKPPKDDDNDKKKPTAYLVGYSENDQILYI